MGVGITEKKRIETEIKGREKKKKRNVLAERKMEQEDELNKK